MQPCTAAHVVIPLEKSADMGIHPAGAPFQMSSTVRVTCTGSTAGSAQPTWASCEGRRSDGRVGWDLTGSWSIGH